MHIFFRNLGERSLVDEPFLGSGPPENQSQYSVFQIMYHNILPFEQADFSLQKRIVKPQTALAAGIRLALRPSSHNV